MFFSSIPHSSILLIYLTVIFHAINLQSGIDNLQIWSNNLFLNIK